MTAAAKAHIIKLMREAEIVLTTNATMQSKTFDDVEMQDAELEDKFEHLRNMLHNVVRDCDELLD
jgi:hypothetical protein